MSREEIHTSFVRRFSAPRTEAVAPVTASELLLVEEDVPATARLALRKANLAPADQRNAFLREAATALYRDAHLDCDDARELVGLDS